VDVTIKYKSDKYITPETAIALADEYKNRILFNASEQPYFALRTANYKPEEILPHIREIVEKISSFHNL
jgi:hypothetical protein